MGRSNFEYANENNNNDIAHKKYPIKLPGYQKCTTKTNVI